MLEFICAIPDHVGWMLVGAIGAYTSVMGWKVGKVFYEMWKDYHTPDGDEIKDIAG